MQAPPLARRAALIPSTFAEGAGGKGPTVEITWTTGERTMKAPMWEDPFIEQLSMEESAVRLDRINNGGALLDSHGTASHRGSMPGLDDQIGVVERAWIADGVGRAIVRFSTRESIAWIVEDVRAGVITNASFGYHVHGYRDITQLGESMQVRLAFDWEPFEITLLPIAADSGTSVRSSGELQPLRFEDGKMDPELETPIIQTPTPSADSQRAPAAPAPVAAAPAPVAPAQPTAEQLRQEGARLEQARQTQIRSAVNLGGLPETVANDLCNDTEMTGERAGFRVLEMMADRDGRTPTNPQVQIVNDDQGDVTLAVQHAVEHRLQLRSDLPGRAAEFRHMGLLRMGEELLTHRADGGMSASQLRGMPKLDLARRALHTTSDFPGILANVANNVLRRAYEAAPRTFLPISRRVDAPDFKQIQRVQLGDAPVLEELAASGEIKRGSVGEAKETYFVKTYAKIIGLTRQAMVNDDLSAFDRLVRSFGRSAAELEGDLVWGLITGNITMGDGVALFHSASHGNDTTSNALTKDAAGIAALGAVRTKMRVQKSIGLDKQRIRVAPAYLAIPAALETVAQGLTADVVPNSAGDVNPFASAFQQVLVEPRLDDDSATTWYMFGHPDQIDVVEYAYLDGQDGPMVENRDGFDVDGMEVRARLDFGAAPLDFRGAQRSKA
jgi:hypothetical protein